MSGSGNEKRGLHAPPVTKDVLQATASVLGVRVPEKWEKDFTVMLAGAREAMEQILGMEGASTYTVWGARLTGDTVDFIIQPDVKRFPRKDISQPTPDDNPHNAWATKVIVENANSEEASLGSLAGKTVVLKDNICLAEVPCEFGTKVFEGWVPKTDATVVTRVLEAGGKVCAYMNSLRSPTVLIADRINRS